MLSDLEFHIPAVRTFFYASDLLLPWWYCIEDAEL